LSRSRATAEAPDKVHVTTASALSLGIVKGTSQAISTAFTYPLAPEGAPAAAATTFYVVAVSNKQLPQANADSPPVTAEFKGASILALKCSSIQNGSA